MPRRLAPAAPHPLDPTEEFCCPHQCFPAWDARALIECISVPVPVRERRLAEQAAFKEGWGVAVRGRKTDHLGDSAQNACLRDFGHYDVLTYLVCYFGKR